MNTFEVEIYEIRIAKNGREHKLKCLYDRNETKKIVNWIYKNRPNLFPYFQYYNVKVNALTNKIIA